jgi:2-hydroxy-6-oxonona-2,4-dienedioate hydrolase
MRVISVVTLLLCSAIAQQQPQAASPRPSMPPQLTAEVHGLKIRYFDLGDKSAPVVLLLHGMGAEGSFELGTGDALAKNFRVIIPDQVGQGASDKPAITYRIATFGDFNKGLLDSLGIKHASVVGESLGGGIAADMVLRFPETFAKLAITDSAGVKPDGHVITPADYRDQYISSTYQLRELLRRLFRNKGIVTDEMVERTYRRHMESGDAAVIASFLDHLPESDEWLNDRAAQIKAPTLVMWCTHDEILPVAGADFLAQHIANAHKVLFDHCGHVPSVEDRPAYEAALLQFLVQ